MNHGKPKIGVTADYRGARKDAPAFSFLCSGYYDALVKSGAVPLVIPPLADEADIGEVLDVLDGVVMVGGADLDPRIDGFMLHPAVRLLDRRRELFDRELMRLIAERRMPVLGIGVGMQLLNVSQGGNLFLHIAEDLPRALPHADPTDPTHRHALEVVPKIAHGAGLRRGRDPCEQHAPHGGGRSGPRLRRHRPLPRRRRRGHRKHHGRLVRPGHAVPSRRATPPRPWTCGSSRNS